jgi:hypothetical protein
MTAMINTLRIARLKSLARQHYIAYQNTVEGMSCGRALADHVSALARSHADKFNDIMDKLAKIDPSTPTSRL